MAIKERKKMMRYDSSVKRFVLMMLWFSEVGIGDLERASSDGQATFEVEDHQIRVI